VGHDVLTLALRNIRGTDTNSLLRYYDQAHEIFSTSPLHQERSRAEKAIQRIAKELAKRKVTL